MTHVSSSRVSTGLLAALLLLTGCDPILRFYGDDYGNTEEHQEQIRILVADLDASLQRNQADLARLVQAASLDPALRPYAEQMALLVATQEAVLAEQREWVAGIEDEDDYRELNRHYGAFITQQQMIQDRYVDIARRMEGDARVSSYVDFAVSESRYALMPPQYTRIANRMHTPSLPLRVVAAPVVPGVVSMPDTTATMPPDTTAGTR